MESRIFDEENGLWYEREGDYYIPEIDKESFEVAELGMYGNLRLDYLAEKRPMLKAIPFLCKEEYAQIAELEQECWERRKQFIEDELAKNPAPSKHDTLAYVQHMNVLIHQINEIIFNEYIYV